jgi:hypothetical protein
MTNCNCNCKPNRRRFSIFTMGQPWKRLPHSNAKLSAWFGLMLLLCLCHLCLDFVTYFSKLLYRVETEQSSQLVRHKEHTAVLQSVVCFEYCFGPWCLMFLRPRVFQMFLRNGRLLPRVSCFFTADEVDLPGRLRVKLFSSLISFRIRIEKERERTIVIQTVLGLCSHLIPIPGSRLITL